MNNNKNYDKTIWVDEESIITANSLNKIEEGIVDIENMLNDLAIKIG